jgi:hypothetical protein
VLSLSRWLVLVLLLLLYPPHRLLLQALRPRLPRVPRLLNLSALSSVLKSEEKATVTAPKGTCRDIARRAWVCREESRGWWELFSIHLWW